MNNEIRRLVREALMEALDGKCFPDTTRRFILGRIQAKLAVTMNLNVSDSIAMDLLDEFFGENSSGKPVRILVRA